MNFESLIQTIQKVHTHLQAQASKAINTSLTIKNWLIGYYIEEYERNGVDRAKYGDKLMESIESTLQTQRSIACNKRELYRYRQFYLCYPQIVETVSPQFKDIALPHISEQLTIVETASPQLITPGKKLIENLSFSHLTELIKIDDDLKRFFYEFESIRNNWSFRELKRQIASLYYERSALSKNKEKLMKFTQQQSSSCDPALNIRDPYIFEFLGIKSKEAMHESDLEDALLEKLENFLLEMGHGFCFEAKQKRILIGETYNFIDLVFYHRILKCHVLIELKIDEFNHEYLGQLNTYVNWYQKNQMTDGDNPPIGILLCTQKDHALVEYALAGIDNNLFVSKYQLELPKREEMQKFLEDQLKQ